MFKILGILLEVVELVLPFIATSRRKRREQELDIAKTTIKQLTSNLSAEEKGRAVEAAVNELHVVKNLKKRGRAKINKAKDRLYKKLF